MDSEYRRRFFKADVFDSDSGGKLFALIDCANDEEDARLFLKQVYGSACYITRLQELADPSSQMCHECGKQPAQAWFREPGLPDGPIFAVCLDCRETLQEAGLRSLKSQINIAEAQLGLALADQEQRPNQIGVGGIIVLVIFGILILAALFLVILLVGPGQQSN